MQRSSTSIALVVVTFFMTSVPAIAQDRQWITLNGRLNVICSGGVRNIGGADQCVGEYVVPPLYFATNGQKRVCFGTLARGQYPTQGLDCNGDSAPLEGGVHQLLAQTITELKGLKTEINTSNA